MAANPVLRLYLDPIQFDRIYWQDVHQCCQIRQIRHDVQVHEVFWDANQRLPLIQFNRDYFHLSADHINGTAITVRDAFRAMNIHNERCVLSWPDETHHNLHNILDTPVINAPACQVHVYAALP